MQASSCQYWQHSVGLAGVSSRSPDGRAPAVPVHTRLAFSSLRALTPGGSRGRVSESRTGAAFRPAAPAETGWDTRHEELGCVVGRAAGLERPA